ncbi:hypothetical protein V1511DRAFT_496171, partial [Dipodascopsis uninucleata]
MVLLLMILCISRLFSLFRLTALQEVLFLLYIRKTVRSLCNLHTSSTYIILYPIFEFNFFFLAMCLITLSDLS